MHQKKRILYVEDEPDVAGAVKFILDHEGYKVDIAEYGKKGVDMSKQGSYDLILLDFNLPDMTGWDVYQVLKGIKSKFAFLTVMPMTKKFVQEIKQARIVDYITKPFIKSDFVKRINKALNEKEQV